MRTCFKAVVACGIVLAGVSSAGQAAITVTVDPVTIANGFMNVFELPANGGGYVFGSGWGAADLNSSYAGSVVTLTPNTSISRDVALTDAFWWQASGAGNKNMFASLYADRTDIAGELVTFTGIVQSNTLVSPYTSVAFIKDFAADYSSFVGTSVPLTPGTFEFSFQTTAGHHIQYGFETVGPNASIAAAPGLGSVVVAPVVVPEPSALAVLAAAVLPLVGRRRRV